MLRRHATDGAFAAGLALLLTLFGAGIVGATRQESAEQELPVQVAVDAPDAGRLRDETLLVPGGARSALVARLSFELPEPDPLRSRWVLRLPRDPVDAIWLEGTGPDGAPWQSRRLDFFAPEPDAPTMPVDFLFPLPADWSGPVVLRLHVDGAVHAALRPRLLREADAMQGSHLAVALDAAAYAGLFMLALIVLVLYLVARERAFIAAFAATAAFLLFLSAINGHLYQLPVFALYAGWRSQGLWVLLLLFCASLLPLLLRYAELRGGHAPAGAWLERASLVLVGLAAFGLVDLPVLRPWMQVLSTFVWVATAVAATLVMSDAVRRKAILAWPILMLLLLALASGVAAEAVQRGLVGDVAWAYYGFQVALVGMLSLLSLGLLTRVGDYREERDRDQLARQDSERRMHRESARSALTLALQTRLRTLPAGDIPWVALRLLAEHLRMALPLRSAAIVARGYHGGDQLAVEPSAEAAGVEADIASRGLQLKRVAGDGVPLQQPRVGPRGPCIEALVPLRLRAPGWGLVLLRRDGEDGFSTEELALAGEFARLATLHANEAVAAFKLRRSAELDALTGTFNRRSIDQLVARAFLDAGHSGQPLSLLFIDIDHFKGINDRLGHAGGDHCLREVSRLLRDGLGEHDVLGRYGGEEFVVLLPGRGGAEARALGERLRAAVERAEFAFESHVDRVTVSIGVATRLDGESTPAPAIERADKALYAAKHDGRNCVRVAPAVFT